MLCVFMLVIDRDMLVVIKRLQYYCRKCPQEKEDVGAHPPHSPNQNLLSYQRVPSRDDSVVTMGLASQARQPLARLVKPVPGPPPA